ncbi:MAG: methylmalonyl Co-A mutase-associated GTPase MeaB [Ignavibacteria bacterium]|nr:methylmalonyl Co-A mutase-associated GTPase MeaB [Bacteroidota bacterium]MSQ46019.1 methylmalonyl Co-A mutase-associated GTPase MeaB [Ignavibacteria bacterium]
MGTLPFSINEVLSGEKRSIAKAITFVENEEKGYLEFLNEIYKKRKNGYRIGITGPPGAGKSTITSKLAILYKDLGFRVGIIAVDPTSPFTGGALLGDRVRMSAIELDPNIFIRSMASRGSLGGLSKSTREVSDILDAAGFEIILLETVGVGQSELDIVRAADTTIVTLVPESGDVIQAMKAGLMEIADIFLINKSDRPGSEQAVMSIQTILGLRDHDETTWIPKIIKTIATDGKGVENIISAVSEHKNKMEKEGSLQKRRIDREKERIEELVNQNLLNNFWNEKKKNILNSNLENLIENKITPYELLNRLVNEN